MPSLPLSTPLLILLHERSRPDFWYWESVEMLRKVLLTGVISVFRRGSVFQLIV
eukprot:COSAG05_NODE_13601_length_424_cov_0.633846_2_plen_53_part_01